jgi:hypothetical protein
MQLCSIFNLHEDTICILYRITCQLAHYRIIKLNYVKTIRDKIARILKQWKDNGTFQSLNRDCKIVLYLY